MKLAVPSEAPGGMEAQTSGHFGHCAVFTMVDLDGEKVNDIKLVPNVDHAQGGCMAPVMMLKQAGAEALVAGGMGARPLAGFQQVGIEVYFNEGAATVGEAVEKVATGQARVFGPAQVCGGGGGGAAGGACQS